MKTENNSIFNLIEIFGQTTKGSNSNKKSHPDCDTNFHHDFYCKIKDSSL